MDALDGNAIAGLLQDIFGNEMTTAVGVCATCGATHQIGELRVYLRGPGSVVRCKTCGSINAVLVEMRGRQCVDLRGFAHLEKS